ncbi:MAG TPA: DUF2243 domain-containing protein [Rhodoglobus sp.]|nr:DUF2243 domain-containing protein [Rhodoglobus sp.]
MDDGTTDAAPRPSAAPEVWAGVLFGVGAIAFVDEAVFHQVLHWHHFYDLGTTELGLVSDGFFHALSWFATIAGLFLLAHLRRRDRLSWPRWTAGVLIGAGAFQLYDGTVHHKLLGIHEIRYVDDVLVYDIVWNATALVLIGVGTVLALRTRHRSRPVHEAAGTPDGER